MPLPLSPRACLVHQAARPLYTNDDPSHDFDHVERVIANCLKLAGDSSLASQPINTEFLVAAALLHDAVNLPKDHPERMSASLFAAERSFSILVDAGFGAIEIKQIQLIIQEHSYSAGHSASTVEAAILQDADRLDALGAIGIMRTVTCGTKFGSAYYRTKNGFAVGGVEPSELDDTKFVVDHFYKKLLKLSEEMNTALGKRLAGERTMFMKAFLSQLESESIGET